MPTVVLPPATSGGPVSGYVGTSKFLTAAFDGAVSPVEWAGLPFTPDPSGGGATQYNGQALSELVAISLFTHRRAEAGDALDDAGERFGWFGDTYNDTPIGSRLWLLRRRKTTDQTVIEAEHYASEALQWLVDYDIASAVAVEAVRFDPQSGAEGDALGLAVTISRGEAGAQVFRFSNLWALELQGE